MDRIDRIFDTNQLGGSISEEKNKEQKQKDFRKGLEELINSYSMENGSNTPDFILAEYLHDCLQMFDKAVAARSGWYGDA